MAEKPKAGAVEKAKANVVAKVKANQLEKRSILVGDRPVEFNVDVSRQDEPAYFVLGVRKSGSTMLNKAMTFVATRTGHHCVDWPERFFNSGFTVSDWVNLDFTSVLTNGNVYKGFRSFPRPVKNNAVFTEGLKVLLVRDPRDALVSQYYSDAFSHKLPKADALNPEGRKQFIEKRAAAQAASIDDYVLAKAGGMNATLLEFGEYLDDKKLLLLKYEQVIFQKRWMINKICNHFGWVFHPGKVDNLMKTLHVIPSAEDEKKFVRKAIPGDHEEKLKPETIKKLNIKLAKSLEMFDYY